MPRSNFSIALLAQLPEHQQSLCDNARVIWSADRTVRKRFKATTDVLHAGWGSFADGGRTLCVLHATELTTVSDRGQVNTLPLAAAYTRVWSLPVGILLTVSQTNSRGVRNTG